MQLYKIIVLRTKSFGNTVQNQRFAVMRIDLLYRYKSGEALIYTCFFMSANRQNYYFAKVPLSAVKPELRLSALT